MGLPHFGPTRPPSSLPFQDHPTPSTSHYPSSRRQYTKHHGRTRSAQYGLWTLMQLCPKTIPNSRNMKRWNFGVGGHGATLKKYIYKSKRSGRAESVILLLMRKRCFMYPLVVCLLRTDTFALFRKRHDVLEKSF